MWLKRKKTLIAGSVTGTERGRSWCEFSVDLVLCFGNSLETKAEGVTVQGVDGEGERLCGKVTESVREREGDGATPPE